MNNLFIKTNYLTKSLRQIIQYYHEIQYPIIHVISYINISMKYTNYHLYNFLHGEEPNLIENIKHRKNDHNDSIFTAQILFTFKINVIYTTTLLSWPSYIN